MADTVPGMPMDVNTAIRAEMARRLITQREVAEHLGLTQATVSSRMTGKTDWTVPELVSVAGFLGVEAAALLTEAGAA